ncbi:amidase signature domain-containing protein [Ilyonectria destructans]|nr:amidase signature domain-containing protein [Ilyonectria destructans]
MLAVIETLPVYTGLAEDCSLLSSLKLKITEDYDAWAFAAAIASQELTAVQVGTAFAKRAIIAHQLSNCLTEWFLDDAIDQARALDAHLSTTSQTVGPLHGVPISLKAPLPLAGHYNNLGYRSTIKRDQSDCHIVSTLRKAGAVFYCKANQPQDIMHLETTSFYGRTVNPHNTNLLGSVLGVAGDSGGNIRGPAAFFGIYGFKPTTYTHPLKGFLGSFAEGGLNIVCSLGPMCTSLRDVDFLMATISSAKPYWRTLASFQPCIPLPEIQNQNTATLEIGFMMHDGAIMPQPPVTRALRWAQAQLETMSRFQVKDFEPFRTAEAIKNARLAFWQDGGKAAGDSLAAGGDPILPLTEWILKDATENGKITLPQLLSQR